MSFSIRKLRGTVGLNELGGVTGEFSAQLDDELGGGVMWVAVLVVSKVTS